MSRIFWTLFIVFIASFAFARSHGGMQIDPSTQRPGGDYTEFYVNNYEQCAESCSRDSRCHAFDFNRDKKKCWLKDRVPRPVTNYSVVSGTKRGTDSGNGNKVIAGIYVEQGRSRPGGDYTNFRAKHAEQCAMECSKDPRCQAFDFNGNDRTCWLKDRVSAAINGRNIVSGAKRYNNSGGGSGGSGGYHPDGDIYWDYASHRSCPKGYVNCDAKGSCGRRGNEETCRNLGGGSHRSGDIYWDYASHRPCSNGYVNCDAKGSCGRRGNEETCRNLGHGSGGHGRGGIYWDYSANRPCPTGYVNCDRRGSCGKRGDASRCR